jgi:hypothetical protein
VADGEVDGVADADAVGSAALDAAATGAVPGEAEASTSDTARKPRPMAAAAEAVQAAPSTTGRRTDVRVVSGRVMPGTVPPEGLRGTQDAAKERHRCVSTGTTGS